MFAENFSFRRAREPEPPARGVSRLATSPRLWRLRRRFEGVAAFALITLLLAAAIALRAYLYVPRW